MKGHSVKIRNAQLHAFVRQILAAMLDDCDTNSTQHNLLPMSYSIKPMFITAFVHQPH
ncbi:hypothetical protein L4C34_18170 [Vibrio profundum]|uniref:hypothetical protein n=1 Tax=Vibrio profundum TaxID=2910247 RepID=UPI003D10D58D